MIHSIISNNLIALLSGAVFCLTSIVLWQFFHNSKTKNQLKEDYIVRKKLFDAMQEMVFLYDLQGKVIDCNKSFALFHGINMHDVQNKTLAIEHLLPQLIRQVSSSSDSSPNRKTNQDQWLSNALGQQVLLSVKKTLIRDENGHLTGVLGIPFSIDEVVFQVTDMFEDRIMDRNLYFVRNQEDIPNYLVGDPTKLRQILVNLLGNAIKFTQEGGITLGIKTRARYKDKTFLVFSITDTGIGIDPGKIENLFSDFTQEDSTTTRQYGGTGLGLALCQKLVGLMGGNIWVDSEKGKGSTFNFALPFTEQTKEQSHQYMEQKITEANGFAAAPGKPLAGYTILLVDDNEINREVFSELLSQNGGKVDLATNGQEAVNSVSQKRYDVVLMDMQMPVMNGVEATKAIRKELKMPDLPIIALTANATEDDRRACIEAGMNGHLTKPVNPPDLVDTILKNSQPSQTTTNSTDFHTRTNQEIMDLKMDRHEDSRIPGLDIREVMDRIGGKKDLLARLIKMFLDQHTQDCTKINEALDRGDRDTAISLTHALKGTSGNLSAFRVFTATQNFEKILRQKETPLPLKVSPDLAASLETVVKSMTTLLVNMNSRSGKNAMDPHFSEVEIEHKLTQLESMIEENDILAEESFLELKPSLAKILSPQNLDPLEQALEVFNYTQARAELVHLQAAMVSNQL